MPTIAHIGSIQIRLYYDDHGIAHFHAVAPEFDCKFTIVDCTIISATGKLRGRDSAVIRAWASRHRQALWSNWALARQGKPLDTIED